MKKIAVSDDVFLKNPGYIRGVVQGTGITNSPSPEELVVLLRGSEARLRALMTTEQITTQPKIIAWREAFRHFGAKPTEYRPSIEAIVRRVVKGDAMPSISRIVDIGTIVSINTLAPVGAHATDVVRDSLDLRVAAGTESFVAFGSDVNDPPLKGEIIFADGEVVVTRRWTWRQSIHTLVTGETHSVEFNVDGLPPVTYDEVLKACGDVCDLGKRHCGGVWDSTILTRAAPHVSLRE